MRETCPGQEKYGTMSVVAKGYQRSWPTLGDFQKPEFCLLQNLRG